RASIHAMKAPAEPSANMTAPSQFPASMRTGTPEALHWASAVRGRQPRRTTDTPMTPSRGARPLPSERCLGREGVMISLRWREGSGTRPGGRRHPPRDSLRHPRVLNRVPGAGGRDSFGYSPLPSPPGVWRALGWDRFILMQPHQAALEFPALGLEAHEVDPGTHLPAVHATGPLELVPAGRLLA